MTEEPHKKKQKTDYFRNAKRTNYNAHKKKYYLEPGQKGFLATCNFREKDCIRECYNLLNQYCDELCNKPEKETTNDVEESEAADCQTPVPPPDDDQPDILDTLGKEIAATKSEAQQSKYRFQAVDTGANNCLFIKTTLSDPVELGFAIAKDISDSKARRTRHLLRLIPIDIVCRANKKDIIDSAGAVFDKHFLKDPKTFSVAFNKRYNNDIKRDEIIKELADLVASKNIKNKVDLKNAETTVVVEVIKGLCCLSVVPHYLKLKKYNLSELANATNKEDVGDAEDAGDAGITPQPEDEVKEENKNDDNENV